MKRIFFPKSKIFDETACRFSVSCWKKDPGAVKEEKNTMSIIEDNLNKTKKHHRKQEQEIVQTNAKVGMKCKEIGYI